MSDRPGGFFTDPDACRVCGLVMCEGHPVEPDDDEDRNYVDGWLAMLPGMAKWIGARTKTGDGSD